MPNPSTDACFRHPSRTGSATSWASRRWPSATSSRPTTSTASSLPGAPTCARWPGRTSTTLIGRCSEPSSSVMTACRGRSSICPAGRSSSATSSGPARWRSRSEPRGGTMTDIYGVYRPDQGSHALITGGGTGIGAAIAARLGGGDSGVGVTVVGRRPEPLRQVADGLEAAQAVTFDVTDEAAIEAGLATATERFGPVDILVNSAGAAKSSPFGRTTIETWHAMLEANLTGVFLVSRAVLPAMLERRRGRIVSIASTAGLKGYAYVAAYCAAKHGVIGLTRSLALEVARNGVTVNAICPGYTETELLGESIANIVDKTGVSEDEARAQLLESNPQGRFVLPVEVAEAAAWLVNPNAGAITGQAVVVAGGEVM